MGRANRIFYYPGARFDTALLVQSFVMIGIQLLLLKIALDHRPLPSSRGGEAATPFAGAKEAIWDRPRPYNFWQWKSPKPYVFFFFFPFLLLRRNRYSECGALILTLCRYWQFLMYLFLVLVVLEFMLSPFETLYQAYSSFIGCLGLSIEATLPLPQILTNARSKSCKGFRFSVLASWLIGDCMKMYWFFTSTTLIPLAFKVSGIFQASSDFFLGFQYLMYGNGDISLKEWELQSPR